MLLKTFKPSDIKKINVLPFQRESYIRTDLKDSVSNYGILSTVTLVYSSFTGERKLYTLDGGHRLLIYSLLEKDFPVLILDDVNDRGDLIEKMSVLNISQKPWGLLDYLNIYICLQDQNYIQLNQFLKKYGFTISTACALLGSSRNTKGFKRGEFKIISLEEAVKTAEIVKLLPGEITGRMILAIHKLRQNHSKFNFEVLKKNILKDLEKLKAERYDDFVPVFSQYFEI